jgi:hypothetical protein
VFSVPRWLNTTVRLPQIYLSKNTESADALGTGALQDKPK